MKKLINTLLLFFCCIILVFCKNVHNNGTKSDNLEATELIEQTSENEYEWLNGEWIAESITEWGTTWARAIFSNNKYKILDSNSDKSIEDISSLEWREFSIERKYNHIIEEEVLAIDYNTYIDEKNKKVVVIFGEFESLVLNKVNNGNANGKSVSNEANPLRAFTTYVKSTYPSYGLKNENLKGNVKSYFEKTESNLTNYATDYEITKKFDTLGRIIYYEIDGGDRLVEQSLYSLNYFRNLYFDKVENASFRMNLDYINPLHILGVSSNRYDHFNSPYEFFYNEKGLVEKINSRGNIKYTCEYDEYGRMVSRSEDGKPFLKIIWDKNKNVDDAPFQIKQYNSEGGVAKTITYNRNGNTISDEYNRTTFTLIPGSYVIQQEVRHEGSNVKETKIQYSSSGQIISASVRYEDEYRIRTLNFYTYEYDNNGNIVKYSEINKLNDEETITKWKYEYDEVGNWVSSSRYRVQKGDVEIEKLEIVTTRKYEYYENN